MKRAIAYLFGVGFVVSLVAAGCGDDTNNPNPTGGSGTDGLALENLGAEETKVYCANMFSCCTSMEVDQLFQITGGRPTDEADCIAKFQMLNEGAIIANYQDSLDKGRIKYDAVKAAECMAAAKSDCSSIYSLSIFGNDSAACKATFVGLVPDGGGCLTNYECASPKTWCTGIGPNGELGKCMTWAKAGEECLDEAICDDGLVCLYQPSGKYVCAAPLPTGQPCTGNSGECISGLCGATNVCEDLHPVGSACASTLECKDSYCDAQTMKCVALKAEGDACAHFSECQSKTCDSTTMKCVPDPLEVPACDGI